MAIKVFKVLTHAIIIGLLLAILMTLVKSQRTSGFETGAPLSINPGPMVAKQPDNLFGINPSIQCVAGPSEKADYYSRGLTPGGLCGGSEYVREQIRDYAIVDGVGGSLLEK